MWSVTSEGKEAFIEAGERGILPKKCDYKSLQSIEGNEKQEAHDNQWRKRK